MVKTQIIPITKEEMSLLLSEIEAINEFDYMLFLTLKTTGRRIGELYGIEDVKKIGKKKIGTRTLYIDGKPLIVDKNILIYKKTNNWRYGVKLKDIDFEKGLMKVWVLKRRQYIQDETILLPEVVRVISGYARKNRLKLEDYVFRRKGRTLRQIQNVLKTYGKKAGVEHSISVHNFRHYFITELKRKGWPNDKIMKLTGHKTAATLSIYDHVLASDIKEDALEDLKDL